MAFYGIPMFGEGLVSKTLDNTIKGKGASVAQQQLNRGLQQIRRGIMGQAAADRSNPALAVRNATLAGSQAATDTNMQAAQLRAQEQATALNQRMAQGQQQGQQFFGQLGAIGKGLAASGVLSPDASSAVGAMSGLAPGQGATQEAPAAQPGGNISTAQRVTQPLVNQGLLGQPQFSADNIAANAFNAKPPAVGAAPAPGGNITTPAPTAAQSDPALMAIYNAATARSGAPVGEMAQPTAQRAATQPGPANPPPVDYSTVRDVRGIAVAPLGDGRFRAVARQETPSAPQRTAFTDPVVRSNQNEMVFGLPGQTEGQADAMNAPLLASSQSGMVFGEPGQQAARSPAQAVLAGQSGGNISTPQAYAPPGAPIPLGNQPTLTPVQAAEGARRAAQGREAAGIVNQNLPALNELSALELPIPGIETFSRSKVRPQDQEPGMVYQDPNRMVFSYDPQDAQRMAQQYGMQPDNGFGVPPEASRPGTGLAQEDVDAYVRKLGGR